ncbi:MAG TPA: hypothetical protein VHL98_03555 [Microvirga sp.]|jgi:hypothetical protein|nr:hypothetical protein [Microvirga sp.]
MADEVLIAQGLEALEGLISLILEEALDRAVSRPPDDADERLLHLAELSQAGADLVVLAEAAALVLRRWPDAAA